MADGPPIDITIENTPKHCAYGGQVSVHIRMAGKELLRYEALTTADAQDYIDNLEYIGPRLNDRREWEVVIFTDSGFQTLYLAGEKEPQCVMSHCRLDQQEHHSPMLLEKTLIARNLAARYYNWYVRRGWTDKMRVYMLEGVLEILNIILREPGLDPIKAAMLRWCSTYKVEKGVQQFSDRNTEDED
jgi:hypothetical protein